MSDNWCSQSAYIFTDMGAWIFVLCFIHCHDLDSSKSSDSHLYMEGWSTPSSLNGALGMLAPTGEAWAECWHISSCGPGHLHHYKVWLNRDPTHSSQSNSSALNTQIEEQSVTILSKAGVICCFWQAETGNKQASVLTWQTVNSWKGL